jgi:FecR-like protein
MRLSSWIAVLALASPAAGGPPPQQAPAAAAPSADVQVLQAVILKVDGKSAQWRPSAKDAAGADVKWNDAKVDDVLSPGAEIRTGVKSTIALRIGKNATVSVDALTRIALPKIVQDGQVLRTKVALERGQLDVKVDRVGLENDLDVASPTATLAVKGTGWHMSWDAVDGFRAMGAPTNELRAIEVQWAHSLTVWLTSSDATTEAQKIPAFEAFGHTWFLPITGELSAEETANVELYPSQLPRVRAETGLEQLDRSRGLEQTIRDICNALNQGASGAPCTVTIDRGNTSSQRGG